MLAELRELLSALPDDADAAAYSGAIVGDNALGKPTDAARRHARQHLRELYACDPRVPIFRVLRRLWTADEPGQPLIALLVALARDPVLRASAPGVLPLPVGAPLVRSSFQAVIRSRTGDRFNQAVLDKVAQNAGNSWSQSGHLAGPALRRLRRRVEPTPGSLALAVWLGQREGMGGAALLDSRWARVLDRSPDELLEPLARCRRLGLLDVRRLGGVFEISANPLDPTGGPR